MDIHETDQDYATYGVRASRWKIKYAQIQRYSFPDLAAVEDKMRELRKRAISLALRFPKGPSENTASETLMDGEQQEDGEKEEIMSSSDKIIWKHLEKMTHIPVRVAFLGDSDIGRTSTILRNLRFHPADGPIPSDLITTLLPASDRFGSHIFTKCEKGYGKFDFHITIIDPPSASETAQIAALRGVDAVMIGFAVDKKESIMSVVDKWLPFVRKWLGPHIPISAVGTRCDRMADGLPGTEILDILSLGGIKSFDLCVAPYKRCFWTSWVPDGCPMPDGTWK